MPQLTENKTRAIEDSCRFEDMTRIKVEFAGGAIYSKEGAEPLPEELVKRVLAAKADESIHEIVRQFQDLIPMASFDHHLIKDNLLVLASAKLSGTDYQAFGDSMEIYVGDVYRIPDGSVAHKPTMQRSENRRGIVNPVAIFEVLSPSTKRVDKIDKLDLYRSIESLEDYVMLDQEGILVEHYRRKGPNHWETFLYVNAADEFALTSAPLSMTLSEVYKGVE